MGRILINKVVYVNISHMAINTIPPSLYMLHHVKNEVACFITVLDYVHCRTSINNKRYRLQNTPSNMGLIPPPGQAVWTYDTGKGGSSHYYQYAGMRDRRWHVDGMNCHWCHIFHRADQPDCRVPVTSSGMSTPLSCQTRSMWSKGDPFDVLIRAGSL